jgi:Family of unknown function (DUF6529)
METPRPALAWLLIPILLLALVAATLGAFARQTIPPARSALYQPPYFHLFFSDVLQMKVWLTTAALLLALTQLLTATRIYGLLHFPPQGRFYAFLHRGTGFLAIGLILPVAYHCIFLLGYGSVSDTRTLIHAALGTFVYGVFVAKVFVMRLPTKFRGWVLPVLGSLLFTVVLGLWLTSSLWFFSTAGFSL